MIEPSEAQKRKHMAALHSRRNFLAQKVKKERRNYYAKAELHALNWAIRTLDPDGKYLHPN